MTEQWRVFFPGKVLLSREPWPTRSVNGKETDGKQGLITFLEDEFHDKRVGKDCVSMSFRVKHLVEWMMTVMMVMMAVMMRFMESVKSDTILSWHISCDICLSFPDFVCYLLSSIKDCSLFSLYLCFLDLLYYLLLGLNSRMLAHVNLLEAKFCSWITTDFPIMLVGPHRLRSVSIK